jgi:hypothetical protein
MITDYTEFSRLVKESYPDTVESMGGVLSLTFDTVSLSIVPVPADPTAVLFRLRVMDLNEITKPGKLAIAALKGNLFWSGTEGATLSIGKDNMLYLTERRYLEEFTGSEVIEACFEAYARSVNDWRLRGQTYA